MRSTIVVRHMMGGSSYASTVCTSFTPGRTGWWGAGRVQERTIISYRHTHSVLKMLSAAFGYRATLTTVRTFGHCLHYYCLLLFTVCVLRNNCGEIRN